MRPISKNVSGLIHLPNVSAHVLKRFEAYTHPHLIKLSYRLWVVPWEVLWADSSSLSRVLQCGYEENRQLLRLIYRAPNECFCCHWEYGLKIFPSSCQGILLPSRAYIHHIEIFWKRKIKVWTMTNNYWMPSNRSLPQWLTHDITDFPAVTFANIIGTVSCMLLVILFCLQLPPML